MCRYHIKTSSPISHYQQNINKTSSPIFSINKITIKLVHIYPVSTKYVYLTQKELSYDHFTCGHPKNQQAPFVLRPTRVDCMRS